jgi:hypothetical protein
VGYGSEKVSYEPISRLGKKFLNDTVKDAGNLSRLVTVTGKTNVSKSQGNN